MRERGGSSRAASLAFCFMGLVEVLFHGTAAGQGRAGRVRQANGWRHVRAALLGGLLQHLFLFLSIRRPFDFTERHVSMQ
jgi:hypothetical protein